MHAVVLVCLLLLFESSALGVFCRLHWQGGEGEGSDASESMPKILERE